MLKISCKEIAELIGGRINGNPDTVVTGLNRIESSHPGDITFYHRDEYEKYVADCAASAIVVPDSYEVEPPNGITFIHCAHPYEAFMMLIKHFADSKNKFAPAIHPTAIIAPSAQISPNAYIGPYCVIGEHCIIAEGVVLHSRVTLYDNVEIAAGTLVHTGVTCYSDTKIGKNCILHAGAVLGSDGFGFLEDKADGSYSKIPQLGNVIIEDDVEIGANTTIDCALLGSTVVERGVKLDNLIHVAHNCTVGEHTAIAAQTGVSGSTKIGKRNRIGGQVGFAGHMETADDVTIIAQSGVSKTVAKSGIYFGSPIKDRLTAFKIEACIRRLPDLFDQVDNMKKTIENSKDSK